MTTNYLFFFLMEEALEKKNQLSGNMISKVAQLEHINQLKRFLLP